MKTNQMNRQAYVAPETSVDIIEQERCFLSEVSKKKLSDMELYQMFEEDF